MFKPFSKRQAKPQSVLSSTIPLNVRTRILYAMQELIDPGSRVGNISNFSGFAMFLEYVESMIRNEFGGLNLGGKNKHQSQTGFPAIDFFSDCIDARVLDFIEFFFRWREYRERQVGVDRINNILREEGIAFEFSPFVDRSEQIPAPAHFPSGTTSHRYWIEHYPQAIAKSNEFAHKEIIVPALQLLVGDDWKSANEHMMKAHEQYRNGEFRSSITESNSALETALKTICQKKGWKYSPDKDVLSSLIDVMNREGLIYPFYVEILKNCGTVRNKLGAHGTEPKPTFTTEAVHAEHMIHLVSSHILMLTRLAGYR